MFDQIKTIYEDNNVLVINKPAGLAVHGDSFNDRETLVDWLLKKYPEVEDVGESMIGVNGEEIKKPGIVHRLDKDTSGVMIIAKNQETFLFLKEQFQNHTVRKSYQAIVAGRISFAPEEMSRTINLPIGRSRTDARVRVARRNAESTLREAVTIYKVLKNFGKDFTYIEAYPQTGRTHQLRAHFKAIGHPIICDKLYYPEGLCPVTLDRQALHSFSLEIKLPKIGKKRFEAPIPADLQKTLENIKSSC